MKTTIHTNHGRLSGRTIDTIVHREYGRTAFWRTAKDHNSPFYGQILKPAKIDGRNTFIVVSNIVCVIDDRGPVYGPSISPSHWI